MTMFKLFRSVAILTTFVATPALAQRMIDEPGIYAFYHPNGDPGIGSARPAGAMAAEPFRGSMAQLRMQSHSIARRRAKTLKAH